MEFLYGRRPVYEALRAARREFRRVIIAEGSQRGGTMAAVIAAAEAQGVRIDTQKRQWLDQRANGANHQGVLLEAGDYPCAGRKYVLEPVAGRGLPACGLILVLIQDGQN